MFKKVLTVLALAAALVASPASAGTAAKSKAAKPNVCPQQTCVCQPASSIPLPSGLLVQGQAGLGSDQGVGPLAWESPVRLVPVNNQLFVLIRKGKVAGEALSPAWVKFEYQSVMAAQFVSVVNACPPGTRPAFLLIDRMSPATECVPE